ncbi:MAG: NHL repeat-containing protein [Gemmatimonadaceae bacterium]
MFTEREIHLGGVGQTIPRISKLVVRPDGNLFVLDVKGKRIVGFDSAGRVTRTISLVTDSLGKSYIGPFAFDRKENLFVYSPVGRTMAVFTAPVYRLWKTVTLASPVSDFIVGDDGAIIAYYPADPEGTVKRFDEGGHQVRAVRAMPDDRLRGFHGRVQNGGIAGTPSGEIVAMEPSRFEMVVMGKDLSSRVMFIGSRDNPWTPTAPPLPRGLSPNDYQKEHRTWWDGFLHIDRPFVLRDNVYLVTLFKSRGLYNTTAFANVVDRDGRAILLGVPVPQSGRVVGALGGRVYVVRNAHLGSGDTLAPLKMFEYRLRDGVAPHGATTALNTEHP